MKPLDKATTAARQAATGGRAHCNAAARMATGIMDTDARHSVLCATGIAKIMRRPGSDTTRRVLCHEFAGRTGNSRATQAIRHIGRVTGTSGVMRGTMKPSAVRPRDVRKACIAVADRAVREQAPAHSHLRESMELYRATRRAHGKTVLPNTIICGDYLGQMVHQQVRACATRFNVYTSHAGECTHSNCHGEVETNKHAIAQCPRYANARAEFQQQTGLVLCDTTYVDIMALNSKKLGVAARVLAKALCTLLAHIAKAHTRHNLSLRNASVRLQLIRQQGIVIAAHNAIRDSILETAALADHFVQAEATELYDSPTRVDGVIEREEGQGTNEK